MCPRSVESLRLYGHIGSMWLTKISVSFITYVFFSLNNFTNLDFV